MALKTYTHKTSSSIKCDCCDALVGATVEIDLDEAAVPSFPDTIRGTITSVSTNGQTTYEIEYESDDLGGTVTVLRSCDIKAITCVAETTLLGERIDAWHLDEYLGQGTTDADAFGIDILGAVLAAVKGKTQLAQGSFIAEVTVNASLSGDNAYRIATLYGQHDYSEITAIDVVNGDFDLGSGNITGVSVLNLPYPLVFGTQGASVSITRSGGSPQPALDVSATIHIKNAH